MSKGKIVTNHGEGFYTVEIQAYTAAVTELISVLDARYTDIETNQLPDAETAKTSAYTALETAWSDQSTAIDAYNAEETDETKQDLHDKTVAVRLAQLEYDAASSAVSQLIASLISIDAERIAANSDKNDPFTVQMWCADYTDNLAVDAIVGVCDLFATDAGVPEYVIAPGYSGSPTFVGGVHGQMSIQAGQPATGTFFNAAVYPWWIRYKKRFHAGRIKSVNKDNDTCRVLLLGHDAELFNGYRVSVFPDEVTASVVYQNCHAAVFNNDDLVLVEFNGFSKDSPIVRGFLEEPIDCASSGFHSWADTKQTWIYANGAWSAQLTSVFNYSGREMDWKGDGGRVIEYNGDPSRQFIRGLDGAMSHASYMYHSALWSISSAALYDSDTFNVNTGYLLGIAVGAEHSRYIVAYLDRRTSHQYKVSFYSYLLGGSKYPYDEATHPDGYKLAAEIEFDSAIYQPIHRPVFFNSAGDEAAFIVYQKPSSVEGTRYSIDQGQNDPETRTEENLPLFPKSEIAFVKFDLENVGQYELTMAPVGLDDVSYTQTITVDDTNPAIPLPDRKKRVEGRYKIAVDYHKGARMYAFLNAYEDEHEWVSVFEEQASSEIGDRKHFGRRHLTHYSKYWLSFQSSKVLADWNDGVTDPGGSEDGTRITSFTNAVTFTEDHVGKVVSIRTGEAQGEYKVTQVIEATQELEIAEDLPGVAGVKMELLDVHDDEVTECVLHEAKMAYFVELDDEGFSGPVPTPWGNAVTPLRAVLRPEIDAEYRDENGDYVLFEETCALKFAQLGHLDIRTKTWVAYTEEYSFDFLTSQTYTRRQVLGETEYSHVGYFTGVTVTPNYHVDLYHKGGLAKEWDTSGEMPPVERRYQFTQEADTHYSWYNNVPLKGLSAPWAEGIPGVCGLNSQIVEWLETGNDAPNDIVYYTLTGYPPQYGKTYWHPDSQQIDTSRMGDFPSDPWVGYLNNSLMTRQIVPPYAEEMGHQVAEDGVAQGLVFWRALLSQAAGLAYWDQDFDYYEGFKENAVTAYYHPAFIDNLTGYLTHFYPQLQGINRGIKTDLNEFCFASIQTIDRVTNALDSTRKNYLQGATNDDPTTVSPGNDDGGYSSLYIRMTGIGAKMESNGTSELIATGSKA